MAPVTVQIRVRVAWWAFPVLKILRAWSFVTGRMPDDAAVRRFVSLATKVDTV
jgi:hypothetical protein